jgi:hypothetical protein
MNNDPVKPPQWALESDDAVVKLLLKFGTQVNRANYIRLAFFGERDEDGELDAELEFGLPEPLRRWDENGKDRDIASL